METIEIKMKIDKSKIAALRKDACLFCAAPIKMGESFYKYTASGTYDHYYDWEKDMLRITYTPSETAILFELIPDENSLKRLYTIIKDELDRIMKEHNQENERLRDKLMNDKHIARTLGKDKITAIDAIISKKYIDRDGLYKDLSGMADEMYLHSISESRSTLSERSIKISKSNTDREVYEQYSPYCLKSHLRCWPFGKQDHLTIDFKRFYLNMNKEHIQSKPLDNVAIWNFIMQMPITIVPYNK